MLKATGPQLQLEKEQRVSIPHPWPGKYSHLNLGLCEREISVKGILCKSGLCERQISVKGVLCKSGILVFIVTYTNALSLVYQELKGFSLPWSNVYCTHNIWGWIWRRYVNFSFPEVYPVHWCLNSHSIFLEVQPAYSIIMLGLTGLTVLERPLLAVKTPPQTG